MDSARLKLVIYSSQRVFWDVAGLGGCPMAADALTGNMATEHMIGFFKEKEINLGLDEAAFLKAMRIATEIF